jgi:putative toxin-antitoxin system antitoxin component (TIGR02293 family)
MPTTQEIVESLGGKKTMPRVHSQEDLRACLRKGLSYRVLEEIVARYAIAPDEMGAILGVPARTLARRKRQAFFRADESDRLYRLARIAAEAESVLGDRKKATAWLHRRNRALGGEVPLLRLDTELGARQVEQLLGRIAHGIPG